jgi:hypothetical protein
MLALRWRDAELSAGMATVRRSAGVIRNAGKRAEVQEGDFVAVLTSADRAQEAETCGQLGAEADVLARRRS